MIPTTNLGESPMISIVSANALEASGPTQHMSTDSESSHTATCGAEINSHEANVVTISELGMIN